MRAAFTRVLNSGGFMLPLFAQAAPKNTVQTTQPTQNENWAAISELAGAWWLWLGIIVLIALIGVLIYLRNRPEED